MQQHFPRYSEITICSCLIFFKMYFSSVKKRKIQKLLKEKEKIKIKYNPTTPKLPLLNVWYTELALCLSIQALFPLLHIVVFFYEFYKFMSSINFCTYYSSIFCFVCLQAGFIPDLNIHFVWHGSLIWETLSSPVA